MREKEIGEITPVSAEHSSTDGGDEVNHSAASAIDMDFGTFSKTISGSSGTSWFKVTLSKVYCIQKATWYSDSIDSVWLSWTCTDRDCKDCEGAYCDYYTLTVSNDGTAPNISPVSDCRYGDTVKMDYSYSSAFGVYEFVVIGKQLGSTSFSNSYFFGALL